MIEAADGNVYTAMNALHISRTAHTRAVHTAAGRPATGHRSSFDWAGQVKLAIVLSVAAALVTFSLAGRIAEPVLIVAIIVVASIAGWARIEPVAQPAAQPARQPSRRL